jgi:hypothetical protein
MLKNLKPVIHGESITQFAMQQFGLKSGDVQDILAMIFNLFDGRLQRNTVFLRVPPRCVEFFLGKTGSWKPRHDIEEAFLQMTIRIG